MSALDELIYRAADLDDCETALTKAAREELAALRAEVERLRQVQREYEHEVQAGRSEQHDRLVAEVERLRAQQRVWDDMVATRKDAGCVIQTETHTSDTFEASRSAQPTVCTVDVEEAAAEIVDVGVTPPMSSGGRDYEISCVAEILRKHTRPVSVEAVAEAILDASLAANNTRNLHASARAAIRAVGAAIQNTPKPAGERTAPEEAPLVQHAEEAKVSNAEPPASPQAGALEQLAAEIHSVYMREAERQHDLRHAYDYADLPENIKEYDRVLARWIIERYSKPVRVKLPPVPEKERNFTGIETGLYEEALRDVRRALCEQGVEVEP